MTTDLLFILAVWLLSYVVFIARLSQRITALESRVKQLEQLAAEQDEALGAVVEDYRQVLANIEISTGIAGITQRWEDKHKRGY